MLRDRLAADLKEAVKAQDKRRACTLRLILAAIKDREMASDASDTSDVVSDEDIRAILAGMQQRREESARAYEEAGRIDLAADERAEIRILRDYLPRPMSEAEVDKAIESAIRDVGARSIRDMGRCMARLKEQHPGRMDFAKAGAALREALR
ncbi:MAG TPA: GatB/YqeY domain-containing protein [Paracoccaceae bacterium]|nr:GatB/YqeY domain-containing protein [Paracoccaceae bacterium]